MAGDPSAPTEVLLALGELFRKHGFEGTSLALISEGTGLGKGSLYHLFPGGKEAMAAAVLAQIDGWFEANMFGPLAGDPDPRQAIAAMFDGVDRYFQSGGRVCLVGVFALDDVRDRFQNRIRDYFARWQAALADALRRSGHNEAVAAELAEDVVGGIQGALTLARALGDPAVFGRALQRMRARLDVA